MHAELLSFVQRTSAKHPLAGDRFASLLPSRSHDFRRIGLGLVTLLALMCTLPVQAARFSLQWNDNSTNETGFKIERSSNGSTFSEIAAVGANTSTYEDTNLTNATSYWYRVRAFNTYGMSAYSNTVTGTTPPAANSAPTISNIANQTIVTGGNTGPLAFTIADAETSAGSLSVSATSNTTSLVPQSGLALAGSGSNRTLTVTPIAGQTGTATITVTVSDGSLTASDTFVITVNAAPANTAPTISNITNKTIPEDGTTGSIGFTVGDAQTSAGSLVVSATSSNSTLVPAGAIALGGSGSSRTISVTPSANASGSATITVTVSDGSLTATDTFRVTVSSVNDAPTISDIGNQTIAADTSTGPLAFTIGDVETAIGSLTVSRTSSNTTLVPLSGLSLGGSGANRSITVTPASGRSGTATITITVSDGSLTSTDSFTVTVNAAPANTAPTISDITNRTINEDGVTGSIGFTVGDTQTAAGSLVVSATSSNNTLVPTSAIMLGGSGSNRTVSITPASDASGSATITVTVSDGSLTTSDTFVVTVTAVNDAPTISDIANRTISEDASTGAIAFTVADVDTSSSSLAVSATSSNTSLAPSSAIVVGGSGSNRTVTVTPLADASGSATITVTVSDGSLTASDTFVLTVTAVNDAPTISAIADQTIAVDGTTTPLAFSLADADMVSTSLVVTATSSNTSLVPVNRITFGGSGADRTVTVTPLAGQTGSVAISLSVSDGSLTTSTTFQVSIVGTAPVVARAGDGFVNSALSPSQYGDFEVIFLATPSAAFVDAVVGLSPIQATRYADLAAIVRFNTVGTIDARNGGTYSAATPIPYAAGATYRFRLAVDTAGRTYSAYVTAPGGDEQIVGANFAFRTDQAAASSLACWSVMMSPANSGQSLTVSNFGVTVTPQNSAPVVSGMQDVTTMQDEASNLVDFIIGDAETPADALTVLATSSNPVLVAADGIVFAGSGASRSLIVIPCVGEIGTATVTVTVSDGSLIASESFTVTVLPAPPIVASAGAGFINTALTSPQNGQLTVTFEAIPSASNLDSVVGLSPLAASRYADFAVIVRFSPTGIIDARNGGSYAAASAIPYVAGTAYRFRLVVDVPNRRYSAYVSAAGGSEIAIGNDFAFRTDQASATQLAHWTAMTNTTPAGESVSIARFSMTTP